MKLICVQTCFLRANSDGSLRNLVKIQIEDITCENAKLYLDNQFIWGGTISDSITVEQWIEEPKCKQEVTITVEAGEEKITKRQILEPPVHYELHLVHVSHHDPGYTDLMSHVFERHYEWIDQLLDDMDERDSYPYDERFRVTIEQFWSLEYYLKHAPKERVQKVIDRVKKGDIEITALYGNLITEQLGHEECYRAMYPSHRFAQECGIHLTTASHCDIPGVSWGLCRALCDAGIEFLAADFPSYYDNWGYSGLVPFWNSKKAFGYDGPGVAYWKAQDGKKLLLWDSHTDITEQWDETWIEETLEKLTENQYPYEVYRATVKAGNIDNSRFVPDYADGALEWNRKYTYPHIVISTNEMFQQAFKKHVEQKNLSVPEIQGELSGQDYPLGAMSMAAITMSARKTQSKLVAAQKLYTLTKDDVFAKKQEALLEEAWRDLLFADDHAYGYHFPAGPAMKASYWEKGSYAMRAEATTQDIMDKALSSVADRIEDTGDALRLVVFNPCGKRMSRSVETTMREMDNCGTILCTHNQEPEKLKGYILNNRRRVNPEKEYWEDGLFDLVDLETGKSVPYYIDDLEWDEPEYYAPECNGLGSGTARYGFFELPGGMKKILRFIAEDLPAFGYKCYALVPKTERYAIENPQPAEHIENGIYRIRLDERGICSWVDLRTNKELLDLTSPHRLGEILVRNQRNTEPEIMKVYKTSVRQNTLYSEIKLFAEVDGAHEVCVKITLWRDLERVALSLHMLRSAKPLQTMFVAFPFCGKGFRYQGMLSDIQPIKDAFPDAQSDFLTVKDYVSVNESNILWSSEDTAVVALGDLWPGYISPAHSCVMKYETHMPLTEEDMQKSGSIYAMLIANNFGTNFMCSQSFDGVYKFSFTMQEEQDDVSCAAWGECEQNPVVTQFTDRSRGTLPVSSSLMETEGLHCIVLKEAENQDGYIARLWNHSEKDCPFNIKVKGRSIRDILVCDALEQETGEQNPQIVPAKSVMTVKLRFV